MKPSLYSFWKKFYIRNYTLFFFSNASHLSFIKVYSSRLGRIPNKKAWGKINIIDKSIENGVS